jgi:hypothetical protein
LFRCDTADIAALMYPREYFALLPAFPRSLRVFVIMSFDSRFNARWETVIQPAIKALTLNGKPLEPFRTDATVIGDSILTTLLSEISTARMIFCDLSTVAAIDGHPVRNGNVMYELGLAHSTRLAQEVVVFRSDDDPLLFDVSNVRVNHYDPDNRPEEAVKLIKEAMIVAANEVALVRSLAVERAADSLDAAAQLLLIEMSAAPDEPIQPPPLQNMGQILGNLARRTAIQELVAARALTADHRKRDIVSVAQMEERFSSAAMLEQVFEYRLIRFCRISRVNGAPLS